MISAISWRQEKISVSFSYCWDSTHCCMIFFFVWLCYLFFCVMISLDTFPIKPFIEEFGVFWIVFPLFFSNLAIGNRTDKFWQNADIFSSAYQYRLLWRKSSNWRCRPLLPHRKRFLLLPNYSWFPLPLWQEFPNFVKNLWGFLSSKLAKICFNY